MIVARSLFDFSVCWRANVACARRRRRNGRARCVARTRNAQRASFRSACRVFRVSCRSTARAGVGRMDVRAFCQRAVRGRPTSHPNSASSLDHRSVAFETGRVVHTSARTAARQAIVSALQATPGRSVGQSVGSVGRSAYPRSAAAHTRARALRGGMSTDERARAPPRTFRRQAHVV